MSNDYSAMSDEDLNLAVVRKLYHDGVTHEYVRASGYKYSTSIAEAWGLAEEVHKHGIGLSLAYQTSPGDPIKIGEWGWFAEFRRGGKAYAVATTAPRAICIAWMRLQVSRAAAGEEEK